MASGRPVQQTAVILPPAVAYDAASAGRRTSHRESLPTVVRGVEDDHSVPIHDITRTLSMRADGEQGAAADAGTMEVLNARLAAAEAAVIGGERQRSYLHAEKVRAVRPVLSLAYGMPCGCTRRRVDRLCSESCLSGGRQTLRAPPCFPWRRRHYHTSMLPCKKCVRLHTP